VPGVFLVLEDEVESIIAFYGCRFM